MYTRTHARKHTCARRARQKASEVKLNKRWLQSRWPEGWKARTVTLLQDLLGGVIIVRQGVAGIAILCRETEGL